MCGRNSHFFWVVSHATVTDRFQLTSPMSCQRALCMEKDQPCACGNTRWKTMSDDSRALTWEQICENWAELVKTGQIMILIMKIVIKTDFLRNTKIYIFSQFSTEINNTNYLLNWQITPPCQVSTGERESFLGYSVKTASTMKFADWAMIRMVEGEEKRSGRGDR